VVASQSAMSMSLQMSPSWAMVRASRLNRVSIPESHGTPFVI
jgi:hypothetical protein